MTREFKCTTAPYSCRFAKLRSIRVGGISAIGTDHSFGDHVFQSGWGAQDAGFSSTVVSLFIFATSFIVIQELILSLLIFLSRAETLHARDGIINPGTGSNIYIRSVLIAFRII